MSVPEESQDPDQGGSLGLDDGDNLPYCLDSGALNVCELGDKASRSVPIKLIKNSLIQIWIWITSSI